MNWNTVCDKMISEGYNSLEEHEQVWIVVRGLIDAVNDGGLVSYFYNSWADDYEDMINALTQLEAFEVLELVEEFGEFFGDEVPDDINERNAIINSWDQNSPESRYSESVDSKLMPLLEQLENVQLRNHLLMHDLDPN